MQSVVNSSPRWKALIPARFVRENLKRLEACLCICFIRINGTEMYPHYLVIIADLFFRILKGFDVITRLNT